MQQQNHLVVLVNGLWGWQRDWAAMKKALEAHNDGSYLIHVSAVNVGAQTYQGVDVCGARLAQEVLSLVTTTPSLTTISFISHSMGGLIARYAIGLLYESSKNTDFAPDSSNTSTDMSSGNISSSSSSSSSSGGGGGSSSSSDEGGSSSSSSGRVAGLDACFFISIASPHLGCASSHPNEVSWHNRPFMRWLAAALAAGHLGGHPHLAAPLCGTATAAAAAAADNVGTMSTAAAAAAAAAAEVDSAAQPAAASKHGASSSSSSGGGSSSSSSSRWQWLYPDFVRCRSVIQLMGCDAWKPTPAALTHQCSSSSSNSSSSGEAAVVGDGRSDCTVQLADGPAAADSKTDTAAAAAAAVPSNCCCCCKEPQLQYKWLTPNSSSSSSADCPLLDVLCSDGIVECVGCGGCGVSLAFLSGLAAFKHRLTYSTAGGDHLIPWCSSALLAPHQIPVRATKQAAAAAAGDSSQQLQLPALGLWATRPAIVEQQQQQHQKQQQQQQPTRQQRQQQQQQQGQQQGQQQQQQQGQQQQQHKERLVQIRDAQQQAGTTPCHHVQQQQQQQQQLQSCPHNSSNSSNEQSQSAVIVDTTTPTPPTAATAAAAAAACSEGAGANSAATVGGTALLQHQSGSSGNHSSSPGGGSSSSSSSSSSSNDCRPGGSSSSSSVGVLGSRLRVLQGLEWRRLHVVWPRLLCWGTSHCNIQYNSPMNFVGQAVVQHVCQQLMQPGN